MSSLRRAPARPARPDPEPTTSLLPRRTLLRTGLATAGVVAGVGATGAGLVTAAPPAAARSSRVPALTRTRPSLTHGVASGDPVADGAVVWARADRTARMLVQVSRTPDLARARTVRGPVVTAATNFTGKLDVRGLPSGAEVFYRILLEDPDRSGVRGEPLAGRLVTVPRRRSDVRFLWSGDMVGQGWGINPDLGGIGSSNGCARCGPTSSSTPATRSTPTARSRSRSPLPDGRVWRNVVTPEKSKVAETLAEYRGQWAYNLLDAHVRAFAADVPQVSQWDDHEVTNNWYPGEILDDPRYTEKRVDVLAARARQAFFEWMPVRPTRGTRGPGLPEDLVRPAAGRVRPRHADVQGPQLERPGDRTRRRVLGRRQLAWLTDGLLRSRATWKVVANDLPLGLVVPDGDTAIEGVAQGDPGAPKGRELEFATCCRPFAGATSATWSG